MISLPSLHAIAYVTEENEKIYIEIIVKNQLEIYRKILDMPKENTYVLDLKSLEIITLSL